METDRIVEATVLSEELNFRKAASRLAISQSSLSRHIDDLEVRVGFRLFVRDRHTVRLTPEGLRFLNEVADLPERVDQAIDSARSRPRSTGGSVVRLSYGRYRGAELVEQTLLAARGEGGPLEIDLVQSGSAQSTDDLLSDESDLALVRPPVPFDALGSRVLLEELLGAVMCEDDPLAASPSITVAELAEQPFISVRPPKGSLAVDSRVAATRERHLRPKNIVREADTMTSMFLLVQAGIGVGLSRYAVIDRAGIPGLVIRPIVPALPGIPLYLAWRKNERNPFVHSLRDLIVQSRFHLGPGFRVLDADG
jgi:DNA-binding transcriptional LysR family regulator